MRKSTIGCLALVGLALAACTSSSEDTDQAGASPRLSLGEREVGAAREGVQFSATGAQRLEANEVRVVVAGLDDEARVNDEAPQYYSIQLIEGSRGTPQGVVTLYLAPDIASGTHALVDSLRFLGGDAGPAGAGYVRRDSDGNQFFGVPEAGELVLERSQGRMLSGQFRFTATPYADPESAAIELTGSFRDIELISTIGN